MKRNPPKEPKEVISDLSPAIINILNNYLESLRSGQITYANNSSLAVDFELAHYIQVKNHIQKAGEREDTLGVIKGNLFKILTIMLKNIKENKDIINKLLDVYCPTSLEIIETLFHEGLEKNYDKTVTNLFNYLSDEDNDTFVTLINSVGKNDFTPLHYASKYGVEKLVELLLSNKANVNARGGPQSATPLHKALELYGGGGNAVTLLLNAKADVNALNSDEETPLIYGLARYLVDSDNEDNVDKVDNGLLLEYIDDYDNEDNDTLLECINELLKNGANINAHDKNHNTALHHAAEKLGPVTIQTLINSSALVNSRNLQENTPLHTAAEKNKNIEVVKSLLENKACINTTDKKGNTPLHSAVIGQDINIVKMLLIKAPTLISKENAFHQSPLDFALHLHAIIPDEMVKFLLSKDNPLHIANIGLITREISTLKFIISCADIIRSLCKKPLDGVDWKTQLLEKDKDFFCDIVKTLLIRNSLRTNSYEDLLEGITNLYENDLPSSYNKGLRSLVTKMQGEYDGIIEIIEADIHQIKNPQISAVPCSKIVDIANGYNQETKESARLALEYYNKNSHYKKIGTLLRELIETNRLTEIMYHHEIIKNHILKLINHEYSVALPYDINLQLSEITGKYRQDAEVFLRLELNDKEKQIEKLRKGLEEVNTKYDTLLKFLTSKFSDLSIDSGMNPEKNNEQKIMGGDTEADND